MDLPGEPAFRIGYTTRNLTLGMNTNHTLRLKSVADREKLRGLVKRNVSELGEILRWSAERGFRLFRVGQSFVPFASHPDFPYNWLEEHGEEIREVGDLARSLDVRLSMHPGQFVAPASPNPEVSQRSLWELRYTAQLLDLLGAEDGVMVLHVGGAYGDRKATIQRLLAVLLPETAVLRYLALENDERIWSTPETLEASRRLGVPMVLDVFHHGFLSGGLPYKEAVALAISTWKTRGRNSRPKIHLSSQNPDKRAGAHDEFVRPEDTERLVSALYGTPEGGADIMVEAKSSDLAALEVLKVLL